MPDRPVSRTAFPVRRGARRAPATCFSAALALAVAAVLPHAVQAQAERPDDGRFEEARNAIRSIMAERTLPSVAVAVAEDGEVVWEEAFGWADREERVRATPHTLYSVASVTKPFTATGLMRLVEDGRVDLDEPVNAYLGRGQLRGLAGDAGEATVRRVLSHTAGLPPHHHFFHEDAGRDPPPMAETIDRYGILVSAPGEVFSYSNLGYGVLDHVVARVGGMSYADYMRREVFLPLGLARTSVGLTPELRPHAATRYGGPGHRPLPDYGFDHRGASAVYSSVHDLVRFGLFHLGAALPGQVPVLTEETRETMQQDRTPDGGPGYGLGWLVEPDARGYRRISHSGGMPGVSSRLDLYPEERVAIAVLINTRDPSLSRIVEAVTAAVLPGWAERAAVAEAGQRNADADPGRGGREGPDLGGLRGTWEGALRTWRDSIPARLVVQEDGDVHVGIGGQLVALLNGTSFRDGALRGRFAGRIPTPDAERRRHTVFLELRRHGDTLRGSATARSPGDFALSSYLEVVRRR